MPALSPVYDSLLGKGGGRLSSDKRLQRPMEWTADEVQV